MRTKVPLFGTAALLLSCLSLHANAHGIAGARVFVTTLVIDDPAVADEASLPTITHTTDAGDNAPASRSWSVSGEIDKRITETFGVGVNYGYTVVTQRDQKTNTGFSDLVVTPKWQFYVNPEHEFLASVGLVTEISNTGTTRIGSDQYGFVQPTLYAGKGLGDLPIGVLRGFAVTGEFGYAVAFKEGKVSTTTDPDTGLQASTFNNGYANRWVGGVSLQYSLEYLRSQVKDYGLPDALNRVVPLVEMSWSSPATRPSNLGVQYLIGAGAIYAGDWYQIGAEALFPGNKASGKAVGFITQFHVYFDDLFPNSLGKPLVYW